MNLKWKIQRFFRNFGIENLIVYVVITIGVLWLTSWIYPAFPTDMLIFDRSAILHGQVWRLITFMFVIGMPNPIFIVISLYFYFMIGNTLERTWGTEKFTQYFLVGTLLLIAAGFISGTAVPYLFYLSMFCAYAALYPNEEFLLFFILPIKAKYLAFADLAYMIYMLVIGIIAGSLPVIMSVIASFALLGIYFGGDYFSMIKSKLRYAKFKSNFKNRNK